MSRWRRRTASAAASVGLLMALVGSAAGVSKDSRPTPGPSFDLGNCSTSHITVRFEGDSSFVSILNALPSPPTNWNDMCLQVVSKPTDQALSDLAVGTAQVVGADRLLNQAAGVGDIAWQIGSNIDTSFYVAMRQSDLANLTNSAIVRAEDVLNELLIADGQMAVSVAHFTPVGAIPPPILGYDVNNDGLVGLADLGQVTAHWGQSDVPGWIRADVTDDGAVGLGDTGQVTAHWGAAGFQVPLSAALGPTADCYGSTGSYDGAAIVQSSDTTIAGVSGILSKVFSDPLHPCTSQNILTNPYAGASVWAALQGLGGNRGEIVQIGLMRCSGVVAPGTPCDGQIHVAWAWGNCTGGFGCGGSNNIGPTAEDLGVWDGVARTYRVVHTLGSTEVTLNGSNPTGLTLADGAIPWISGPNVSGVWFCEVWNNGDQCGGAAAQPFYASSLAFQPNPGDPWNNNPVLPGNCTIWQYPEYCVADATNLVHFMSGQ